MAIEPMVFVVEDDRDIRETLVDALSLEGYRAEGALDGLDALERLRAMPAPPDLALVDLMMPRMNGQQLCVEMKNVSAWSSIPIVIVSADAKAKERAVACGAVECLQKPVSLDTLFDVVARVLAGSRSR